MIDPANEDSIDPLIVANSRGFLPNSPLRQWMWG